MDIRSLSFFVMFQLLNIAMAEWNKNTSLYLVDIPTPGKIFTKIFPLEIPSNIRQSDINNYAKYYAFCPNPDARNKNCNYGNLLNGVSQSMTERLEKLCLDPVVYNVARDLDDEARHIQCFQNQKQGHIYDFVYMLCQDGEEFPRIGKIIYKVCYRDDEKQMVFASASIEKPSLLRDASLQDERTYPFTLDYTHWFDDYTRDIVDVSASLYAQASNYAPTFVLPPIFFPFALQRQTFFHYMNIAPMESTLIAGWELFLAQLKDKLSRIQYEIYVYAGLLGVLTDGQGNVVHLGEHNGKEEIPIPSIFWIMIASNTTNRGVVIMIHNINYSTAGISPNQFFNAHDCTLDVCKEANLRNILPRSQFHMYIVCCMPRAINEYFELGISDVLFRFY